MQTIAQGGTGVFTAVYEDGGGNLVDPASPMVDVIDANGVQVVTDATPSRISIGNYSYSYVVPSDGALGVWQLHWSGVVDGLNSGGDDFFNVVTPGAVLTSAYDLLTLDEAKRALNIDPGNTNFDTELALYVTALSERIDQECGPVVKRSVSGEAHAGGGLVIYPDYVPVAAVGSVVEYVGGTATTLTAATDTVAGDYLLENPGTLHSFISRWSNFNVRRFAGGRVVINYVAGRFDSTAAVSALFKQAASTFLVHLWQTQGSGSATFGSPAEAIPQFGLGFAVPNRVVEMLAHERIAGVVA
jgi:hypothetical protein